MSEGLTIKQAAAMLGISRPTVYKAIEQGRLTLPLTREQLATYQPGKSPGRPASDEPSKWSDKDFVLEYNRQRQREYYQRNRDQIKARRILSGVQQ